MTAHFGDEFFKAVDCTGTDNQKQGNKTHIHLERKGQIRNVSNL